MKPPLLQLQGFPFIHPCGPGILLISNGSNSVADRNEGFFSVKNKEYEHT